MEKRSIHASRLLSNHLSRLPSHQQHLKGWVLNGYKRSHIRERGGKEAQVRVKNTRDDDEQIHTQFVRPQGSTNTPQIHKAPITRLRLSGCETGPKDTTKAHIEDEGGLRCGNGRVDIGREVEGFEFRELYQLAVIDLG